MAKVIGICFGLAVVLFVIGSLLPEPKTTNTQHDQCLRNKDNQTEAYMRAQLNGEYSDLAAARELNNICRIFSNQ